MRSLLRASFLHALPCLRLFRSENRVDLGGCICRELPLATPSFASFFAASLLSLALYTSFTWPIPTYFDSRSGLIATLIRSPSSRS